MRKISVRKVLFCSPTASVYGGVQTWLDHICEALRNDGWSPIVGLVRGIQTHNPDMFRTAHPELETIEIDGRGLNQAGRVRAVMRCIKSIQPDIFVPLTVVDAHEAICQHKISGNTTRYLLTIHGNVPAQIADARLHRDFVDAAVCPGGLTCRLLEWIGVPPDRIHHVPNGARLPLGDAKKTKKGKPLRLGYVGRMTRHDKRIEDLVQFVRGLDKMSVDYTLDVVGDGPMQAEIKAALGKYIEVGKVKFHGQQSQDYLYEKIYPELDCLLLFSSSEAFGIAIVEAMMHGVIPITSRFVGHGAEGILFHGKTALLFDIGDIDSAVDNVLRIADDNELRERLSRAAQAQVYNQYTWAHCVEGWINALYEILKYKPRVGSELHITDRSDPDRWERIGLPVALADALRRARLRLFGVPASMAGGAEWPWIRRIHASNELDQIAKFAEQLDHAEQTAG